MCDVRLCFEDRNVTFSKDDINIHSTQTNSVMLHSGP